MLKFRLLVNRNIGSSKLHDESAFFDAFVHDISKAQHRIIIESPFITSRRCSILMPGIESAIRRGVRVVVNTRPPESHELPMSEQAAIAIGLLQELGAVVIYTVSLHRKIAIIDSSILWEGSLNILSQHESCEVMRRTYESEAVHDMINFTKLSRWYN